MAKGKGPVSVQVCNDRLRLVWSYRGKRHYLYIGLSDTKINRIVAEGKAKVIEGDLATGNFDPTLEKYRPEEQRRSAILVKDLLEKFLAHKSKQVHVRTAKNYRSCCYHLLGNLGERQTSTIDDGASEKFWQYLQSQESVSTATGKEIIWFASHCWDWALRQKLVAENPWKEIHRRIKVPPKQRPKPFNQEEITKIVAGFKAHPQYRHYSDFVEFMFGTGCRTGEAIGLRWKHISDDCSVVWIGETVSRGVQGATKTNQARHLPLPKRIRDLLRDRKPENPNPDDLVFSAPKGGPIDDHNFRNRAWVKILEAVEVEYRKPYTTRSTAISHYLKEGIDPVEVAEIAGNSPRIIFQHYAGSLKKRELPDIFS